MGKATAIQLSSEDRDVLESWVRAGSTEQRFVQRARYILAAAEGKATTAIAKDAGVRPATVSKWRTRWRWNIALPQWGSKGCKMRPDPEPVGCTAGTPQYCGAGDAG